MKHQERCYTAESYCELFFSLSQWSTHLTQTFCLPALGDYFVWRWKWQPDWPHLTLYRYQNSKTANRPTVFLAVQYQLVF